MRPVRVIITYELSTCLKGWVLVTSSKVWMVVKLPGEERQCCIVGAGKVIPETIFCVQRCFFSFNIDGFLDSSLKLTFFFVQNVDITVLKRVSPFPWDVGALLSLDLKGWLSCVVPHAYGAVVWSLLYRGLHASRCTAHMTPLSLCLGVFTFGWTNLCLKVFLGLKCTCMSFLEKILLSFSATPATWNYNMFAAVLLSLSNCVVWSICLCWFPSALVGTLSAWWCRVLMTASLCSSGWC